jgi:hypothetical protein
VPLIRYNARCVAAAAAVHLAGSAFAQPDIVFEQRSIDLGIHDFSGEFPRSITIPFRNAGTEPLIISSTGGCASSCSTDRDVYAPGESGVVYVSRSRILAYGPQDGVRGCKPELTTNDPGDALVTLSVSVDARPPVWTMAYHHSFGPMAKDDPSPMVIPVYSRGPDLSEMQVRVVSNDRDMPVVVSMGATQSLHWARTGERIAQRPIIVGLGEGAPIGHGNAELEVSFANAPDRITYRLSISHLGDIHLDPHRVTLEPVRPGQEIEARVVARSRTGVPFRILGIEPMKRTPADVTVELLTGPEAAHTHELLVRCTVPVDALSFVRHLSVITDMDRESKVYLLIFAPMQSERD